VTEQHPGNDWNGGRGSSEVPAVPPGLRQWIPAAAALVLLLAVVGSGFVFASGPEGDTPTPSAVAPTAPTVTESTRPSIDTAPEVDVVEAPKVPLVRTLQQGAAGDDVRRVQERLTELPFDPGPIDGIYGQMTRQAVWAYEKMVLGIAREEMTGQVTPEMWDRMQEPVVIEPRRRTGSGSTHTEIYLVEQVVAVFADDQPILVTHASSGDGEQWCDTVTYDTDPYGNALDEPVEREVCGISKTPGGVFTFDRKVDGIRESPLGSLWDPVYFNYGIAIHGAINVPSYPASHGCVRIPMHISEYFQSLVNIGDRVFVWNGEKEPENLTEREMLPVFDYPNPDATTTTTSTTTTTTTTVPPTTTTVPPTTTTALPPSSTSTSTPTRLNATTTLP
jgi:peptidoglycan hydrolase-like protein with peptidoglycan-binding domain